MSNSDPHKCRLERTHSASFCTKNHRNPFINKKVPYNSIFSSQNLGITSLTLATSEHTRRRPSELRAVIRNTSRKYGKICRKKWIFDFKQFYNARMIF